MMGFKTIANLVIVKYSALCAVKFIKKFSHFFSHVFFNSFNMEVSGLYGFLRSSA